ncbi:MAG TPA: protein-disulfide reductase DsbD domain-containing protein [Polyangiaceae bacterium]|nr:protein-disulfide reductase DsbD domain-containing protein [Polyangiaceae bacterium]
MTTPYDSTQASPTSNHDRGRSASLRAVARRGRLHLGLTLLAASAACSPAEPARAPEPPEQPAAPPQAAWPEQAEPESVVHAEFATSAQAVKPKGKFLLAVRFQIQPGYRISWQNPGDVGKSTRVVFEVPEGFSVSPLMYPAPQRFELPGKLINYGYENETAIFAEVTAPDRVPEGKAFRFDVKAEWLACMDECATEELSAWFELVSSAYAAEPALPVELSTFYAEVPPAFGNLPKSNVDWRGDAALTLKAAKVKWVDFIPADEQQPKLIRMKPAGEQLELTFAGADSRPLRGLAVAEVEGKRSFYDVNVPWPQR